jgi:hypothetical protein
MDDIPNSIFIWLSANNESIDVSACYEILKSSPHARSLSCGPCPLSCAIDIHGSVYTIRSIVDSTKHSGGWFTRDTSPDTDEALDIAGTKVKVR